MTYIHALFAAALLAPATVHAQDVASVEVLPGWETAQGTHMAALRLTLAPGWKTYWRAPGDMGIPPHFDWAGSKNLSAVAVEWPTPTVFREENLTTIGYKDQVVLPLVITLPTKGAPVHLKTTIDMGVCLDVCVPAQLHLDGVINTTATRAEPAIAASLAQRPYTAKEARVAKATCAIRFNDGDLELETTITLPNTGGPELVVIETGHPDLWVSEADTTRHGNTLTSKVDVAHSAGGPIALNRAHIRMTVLGSKHAVDIQGCTPG